MPFAGHVFISCIMIDQYALSNAIVFEDNHLIAVNKQSGWLVQGDKTGDISLVDALKEYIKIKYHKPGAVFLGSIHRLDRPVTGLVLFAKTSKALERMNIIFRDRLVKKKYVAVVIGKPKEVSGILEHILVKNSSTNTVRAYPAEKQIAEGKLARLYYRLLATSGRFSMVEIMPETGRPHQIRVQMATMQCPIMGDLKYGADLPLQDKSIALHALSLDFVHPVLKEPLIIRASVPLSAPWSFFGKEVYE